MLLWCRRRTAGHEHRARSARPSATRLPVPTTTARTSLRSGRVADRSTSGPCGSGPARPACRSARDHPKLVHPGPRPAASPAVRTSVKLRSRSFTAAAKHSGCAAVGQCCCQRRACRCGQRGQMAAMASSAAATAPPDSQQPAAAACRRGLREQPRLDRGQQVRGRGPRAKSSFSADRRVSQAATRAAKAGVGLAAAPRPPVRSARSSTPSTYSAASASSASVGVREIASVIGPCTPSAASRLRRSQVRMVFSGTA